MRERVVVAVLVGMLTVGAASWAKAAEPTAGQEIKSVVAGRMVCSDACQARLDLANGLKKCGNCDQRCNIAHKYCTACAGKLGVCEVCGKQMRAAMTATEPAATAKPAEGEVVAVGPGKPNDKGVIRPLEVKCGDRVLFGKYSGNEIKIDGVEHIILREDEVLGIIEK